jgi:hypothetical protein
MAARLTVAVAALATIGPASAEAYEPPVTFRGADAPAGHQHADDPTLERANGEQRRNGRAFLAAARRAARERFPTVDAAERLGYRKGPRAAYIGMERQRPGFRSPFVHYRSARYDNDDRVLDPERPEALVYWAPEGIQPVLVGFMFRASALRPAPDPHRVGPLLSWHAHAACDAHAEPGNVLQFAAKHCRSGIAHHGDTQMTHTWLANELRAGYAGAVPARELGIRIPGGRHHHDHSRGPHGHDHGVTVTAAQATVANAWALSLAAPLGAVLLLVRGPRSAVALRFLAILALAGVALTHAVELGAHVESAPYLGVLFSGLIVTSSGLALALAAAWRPRATWAAAILTSAAAIGAYAASRTIGLPGIGDHVGDWSEPAAIVALACEAGVVSLGFMAFAARTR